MTNRKVVYTAVPLGISNAKGELLYCIADCQENVRNKRTHGYWIEGDPVEEQKFTRDEIELFAKARAQVWKMPVLVTFSGKDNNNLDPIECAPKKREQKSIDRFWEDSSFGK